MVGSVLPCVVLVCACATASPRPGPDRIAVRGAGGLATVRVSLRSSGELTIQRYDATALPIPSSFHAGRDNRAAEGYALATDAEGDVVFVWYETSSGRTRLSVRRCNWRGQVLWTRSLEATCAVFDAAGRVFPGACEIAVARP